VVWQNFAEMVQKIRGCAPYSPGELFEVLGAGRGNMMIAKCSGGLLGALACCALLELSLVGTASAAQSGRDTIAAAVADPSRPATDTNRDANRKPVETLAFAGIRPGDKVADFIANSGYFTRLFSDLVGAQGHVYAVELNEVVDFPNVAPLYKTLQGWARDRPNVTLDTVPASTPVAFPAKLDVFWISQNYHDLGDKFLGPLDVAKFNRQVFEALRPGGLYIVVDHVAAPGSPADVTETLHRIDPSVVRRQVEAAGFVFVGESKVLANPADDHSKKVFDPAIQGHTDQFIYKFRRR
jgi:predicted methyltransferase